MFAIDHKNVKFRDVEPFVIAESDAWDTLFIIDGFTGNGIHMDSSGRWHMDFGDDESPCYTERVEGIMARTKRNGRPQQTRSLQNMVSGLADSAKHLVTGTSW